MYTCILNIQVGRAGLQTQTTLSPPSYKRRSNSRTEKCHSVAISFPPVCACCSSSRCPCDSSFFSPLCYCAEQLATTWYRASSEIGWKNKQKRFLNFRSHRPPQMICFLGFIQYHHHQISMETSIEAERFSRPALNRGMRLEASFARKRSKVNRSCMRDPVWGN